MVRYDSSYLYRRAEAWESDARRAIHRCTVGGAVIGAFAGLVAGILVGRNNTSDGAALVGLAGAMLCGGVGTLLGRSIGRGRAEAIRLELHRFLIWVQIEENTRPS